MDFRKLFVQGISIFLVVVVVVCIGTAIKRSGEPEKEYNFSEHDNSFETENSDDTESIVDGTEDSTEEGTEVVDPVPVTQTVYANVGVNIRKEPDRNSEWLGYLAEGDSIVAVGEIENEWQEVIFRGQTAYIKAEYLDYGENSTPPSEEDGEPAPPSESESTPPSESTSPSESEIPSEGESESTKPSEDESESTKPSEDESESTQPSEGESESTQPSEGESESTQPSEGESESTQPSEDESESTQSNENSEA